ncbi:MAG: STAS domain-containing protein [Acidimicrobiia bacterium]|nr:STAS domain-containing protein [Actinomycetota bacterium]
MDANTLVVTLSGELDIATAPSLRDQLLPFKYRATRVVYELGHITFLDLGGLRALLSLFDGDIGGVSISEPSRPVRRLLEIVELGSLVAKASVRAADDKASLAV